ncbi:aprataxin and PNK-like factor isoform X1 [Ranitomeya imitator]|uniref:aprataxin and PNK-like factor isoform X1 n=1 Tax=Ranitomeya imitator TaxID=111125 RepID=UPI0037E80CAC
MSGYRLEAADGSGSHVIPVGETVVGRGPLLGIADKRVSRSHAVLEVVDDKLRIKATHVNPCFHRASGKSTYAPLERNEWCWLHSGDCISLLPDKYFFKVITGHPSEEATLRNSQGLGEDIEVDDVSPVPPLTTETEETAPSQYGPSSATNSSRTNGKIRSNLPSAHSSEGDAEPVKPAPRKRVLPNWMLLGDLPVQALPTPVITAGKKKRTTIRKTQSSPSLKSKDEDVPKKRQPEDSLPTTSSNLTRITARPVSLQDDHVEDNEEEEMEEEHGAYTPKLSIPPPDNNSPSGSPSTSNMKPSVTNDNISLSPTSTQNTQQSPKKRVPCMYGDQCYRKNPVHFQEFSHPGDSDYRDVENGSQDDNDDRPECPYGTDCYRKNPQHKLEYKHTRPPGRKLRKRIPKKARRSVLDDDSDNDGEENDYDLEDSFIDDDDEEEDFDITDEDSDWMPDSQDKDSEDVKTLLKEAKKFVRGKR